MDYDFLLHTLQSGARTVNSEYTMSLLTCGNCPKYNHNEIKCFGFLYCVKGRLDLSIDHQRYELSPGTVWVKIGGVEVELHSASDNFIGIDLEMSQNFVYELGIPFNYNIMESVRKIPILHLDEKMRNAIAKYSSMVVNMIDSKPHFLTETLRHLTCAYAYSISPYLFEAAKYNESAVDAELMHRFLNEIRSHYKTDRRITFYADRLNISLGYLSTRVRQISQKPASYWVDYIVINEAKKKLKNTTLTIQEIAYDLNFASQSFFGKYFKRLVGVSPKEWRARN